MSSYIIYSKRYDTRQIWYSRRSVHSEFWIELETKHWFSSSLRFFLPPFPIFPVPNDTSTPRRVPLLLPRAVPTAFQHSSGLKTMTQAGSGQLGQRWRHNCAMFNSKLQETIKRATPVGVMGAECRRNVATPRGNHSLSRRAGAQLVVGCSRSAWAALDNTPCTALARGDGGRWRTV